MSDKLTFLAIGDALPGTACRPFRVITDDGEWVIKGRRTDVLPRKLAAEWLGLQVGTLLGCAVPEARLVHLDQRTCPGFADLELAAGPALAIRYIPVHQNWRGQADALRQLDDTQVLADLVGLDTLLWNEDRFRPLAGEPWKGRPDHPQNLLLAPSLTAPGKRRLAIIDFSEAFGGDLFAVRDGSQALPPEAPTVLGTFPAFQRLIRRDQVQGFCARLQEVLDVSWSTAVNRIPPEWVRGTDHFAITTWLQRRRTAVVRLLEQWLEPIYFGQQRLDLDTETAADG